MEIRIPPQRFDVLPTRLYTPDDLYVGLDEGGYRATHDALIYADFMELAADGTPVVPPRRRPGPPEVTVARRLHDGAISDALARHVDGARVVAIMGGHAVARGSTDYAEVAHLARDLQRDGFLVATGGGPGAMEAANLGAWCGPQDDDVLEHALIALAAAPTYRDPGWAQTAWRVRRNAHSATGDSLGIPTWFYGHEPPNVFANHIAKYFENAVREEGLLAIAVCGVVFAPGRAGTVQEIFQDACQNFYAVYGVRSPMILLGTDYWTDDGTYPAWPLLQRLAVDGGFAERVHIEDDRRRVRDVLRAFHP